MPKGFGSAQPKKPSTKSHEVEPASTKAKKALKRGDIQQAEKFCRIAISNDPNDLEAHQTLSIIYHLQNKSKDFLHTCKVIARLDEQNHEAHNNLGNALHAAGHINDAIEAHTKALNLAPENFECLYNLGSLYTKIGNTKKAKIFLNESIRANPSSAEALSNLSGAYMLEGDAQTARIFAKQSIELNPNNPKSLNNMAVALQNLGEMEESLLYYKKALAINPNSGETLWNYATCNFLIDNYITGLKYLDERFTNPATQIHCRPLGSPWSENSLKECRKLLLVTEQGLGDSLQFIRFVPILREMGIDVSICAQEKLHPLIRESKIHNNPISTKDAEKIKSMPWIPILSVAKFLGKEIKKESYARPYLSTNSSLKKKWKEILEQEKKPIVGINWQGNKSQEKGNMIGRSFPLEELKPLSKIENIKLLSLQKGEGSEQLNQCSFRSSFVESQKHIEEIWDFVETAAIMENCDLIITNDTSVAHLAGGLGKTTWVLLKKVPDWRWGLQEKTFWYPSMRLFRQKEINDWGTIIEELASEVTTLFKR